MKLLNVELSWVELSWVPGRREWGSSRKRPLRNGLCCCLCLWLCCYCGGGQMFGSIFVLKFYASVRRRRLLVVVFVACAGCRRRIRETLNMFGAGAAELMLLLLPVLVTWNISAQRRFKCCNRSFKYPCKPRFCSWLWDRSISIINA